MYWQNSRQYFDELANHYRQADPEYYRTHIQPFYNNPFANVSSSKRSGSGGAKIAVVAVFMLVLIGGAAAAFFLVMQSGSSTDSDKTERRSTDETKVREKAPENEKENRESILSGEEEEDTDGMTSDDHFIVGSKKIAEKDYDQAVYHLKKVKPGTTYYKQSKELLKNMNLLRKYDK